LNFEKSALAVCEKTSIGQAIIASAIKQRTRNLQDGRIIRLNNLHFVDFGISFLCALGVSLRTLR
jgi:hypothetical protein